MSLSYAGIEFSHDLGMLFEIIPHLLPAVGDLVVVVAEPRAALCQKAVFKSQIDETPLLRDAVTVNYIEFRHF